MGESKYLWNFLIGGVHVVEYTKNLSHDEAIMRASLMARQRGAKTAAIRIRDEGSNFNALDASHKRFYINAIDWTKVMDLRPGFDASPPDVVLDLPGVSPVDHAGIVSDNAEKTRLAMLVTSTQEPDEESQHALMRCIMRSQDKALAKIIVKDRLTAFYALALDWINSHPPKGQYTMTLDVGKRLITSIAALWSPCVMTNRTLQPAARYTEANDIWYLHRKYRNESPTVEGWIESDVTHAMFEAVCEFFLSEHEPLSKQTTLHVDQGADGFEWAFYEQCRGKTPHRLMAELVPFFRWGADRHAPIMHFLAAHHTHINAPARHEAQRRHVRPTKSYRDYDMAFFQERLRTPAEWEWFMRCALAYSTHRSREHRDTERDIYGTSYDVYGIAYRAGMYEVHRNYDKPENGTINLYRPTCIRIDHLDPATCIETGVVRGFMRYFGLIPYNKIGVPAQYKNVEFDEFCFAPGHLSHAPSKRVRETFSLPEV